MKKIALRNGLIAVGSSRNNSSIENSKFTLFLAHQIAQNEKVLYLNWCSYSKKLEEIIKSLGLKKINNLDINTYLHYFSLSSFFEIIDLIEKNDYKTIFIDDLSNFTRNNSLSDLDKDLVIKTLNFLVERFSTRIIFLMQIDNESFLNNDYVYKFEPELGFFNWSRMIKNDCNQVIAFNNMNGYIDGETDEFYDEETYKVYELKNETNILENYIINLKK